MFTSPNQSIARRGVYDGNPCPLWISTKSKVISKSGCSGSKQFSHAGTQNLKGFSEEYIKCVESRPHLNNWGASFCAKKSLESWKTVNPSPQKDSLEYKRRSFGRKKKGSGNFKCEQEDQPKRVKVLSKKRGGLRR